MEDIWFACDDKLLVGFEFYIIWFSVGFALDNPTASYFELIYRTSSLSVFAF